MPKLNREEYEARLRAEVEETVRRAHHPADFDDVGEMWGRGDYFSFSPSPEAVALFGFMTGPEELMEAEYKPMSGPYGCPTLIRESKDNSPGTCFEAVSMQMTRRIQKDSRIPYSNLQLVDLLIEAKTDDARRKLLEPFVEWQLELYDYNQEHYGGGEERTTAGAPAPDAPCGVGEGGGVGGSQP